MPPCGTVLNSLTRRTDPAIRYLPCALTAETRVNEGVELFLDARNLTNKKAAGNISAVVDFNALTPTQRAIFHPVERRAVFAGIRACF